jgi:hypothetical protein
MREAVMTSQLRRLYKSLQNAKRAKERADTVISNDRYDYRAVRKWEQQGVVGREQPVPDYLIAAVAKLENRAERSEDQNPLVAQR